MNDLFALTAQDIIDDAMERYRPIEVYIAFSGGNDSRAVAHWVMNNLPGCKLFHINTGIGVWQAEASARAFAAHYGWPLEVLHALKDCGQNYDDLVRQYGFPGPYMHQRMFRCLKERAVELLVRRMKKKRSDKIMLVTGARRDESVRRMRYTGAEVRKNGAQIWVNPIYWWSKEQRDRYLAENNVERNPVTERIGISGECLCGAYAHPGELEQVRSVDPEVAARIDALYAEVKVNFPWTWENGPPRKEKQKMPGPSSPMCLGCAKSAIVQEALTGLGGEELFPSEAAE